MKLAMIGTGWVGFIQGLCFADTGCRVLFVDIDEQKLTRLRDGICPFYEKNLAAMFERNRMAGRISFTSDTATAVRETDGAFICVPTPALEDGNTDLSYVEAALLCILASELECEYPVIVKSTIPADRFHELEELTNAKGYRIDLASNPEFLSEGSAVEDSKYPSRIVVGVRRRGPALKLLNDLYERHREGGRPYFVLTPEEAILVKQGANVFLPVKISMANELALFCEKLRINARAVLKALGADPRIGGKFLHPGPGYGGDCFPKDTRGYAAMAERLGLRSYLAMTAIETNARQRRHLVEKMSKYYKPDGGLREKVIAVWGLSFKGGTNDVRESPAIDSIEQMLEAGAVVRCYDPAATEPARARLGGKVIYCNSVLEAAIDADAIAILTDWEEFEHVDWDEVRTALRAPVIFDSRSLFEPETMRERGFEYISIGRPLPKR